MRMIGVAALPRGLLVVGFSFKLAIIEGGSELNLPTFPENKYKTSFFNIIINASMSYLATELTLFSRPKGAQTINIVIWQ